MNAQLQNNSNHGFLIGFITGGVIGAGLAMLCAPRAASELRQRVTDSAADLRHAASQRYQDVSTGIADVVNAVTTTGQSVRNDVADAVSRGAREVERFATASKTSHATHRS